MAEKLKWEEKRVKHWFQNKRAAFKNALIPADEQQQLSIVKHHSTGETENLKKYNRNRATDAEQNLLEDLFTECTHPNHTQLTELAEKLQWEEKRVQIWFQNKRSASKVLEDRRRNNTLQIEMEKLQLENKLLKEKLNNPTCCICSRSAIPGQEQSVREEQNLMIVNSPLDYTPIQKISSLQQEISVEKDKQPKIVNDVNSPLDYTPIPKISTLQQEISVEKDKQPKILNDQLNDSVKLLCGPNSSMSFDSDRRTNVFSGSADTDGKLLSRPISDIPFGSDRRTNMFAGRTDTTENLVAEPITSLPPDDSFQIVGKSVLSISDMPFCSSQRTNMFAGRTDTAGDLVTGPIPRLALDDSVQMVGKSVRSISDMPFDSKRRINMFAGSTDTAGNLVDGPITSLAPHDSVQIVGKSVPSANITGKLFAGVISGKVPDSVQSADISVRSVDTTRKLSAGAITCKAPDYTSAWWDFAYLALDELQNMAKVAEPLWLPNVKGGLENLDYEHYYKGYARCFSSKKDEFVWDATRLIVQINVPCLAIVDALMDGDKWAEMFPGIICSTATNKVISNGKGGTRHCALNLMQAEFQVVSPLVPLRCVNFLRFCNNINANTWVVVDVSVETEAEAAVGCEMCRRLPSGCVLEKMPNGVSQLTWVEHTQYNQTYVHPLYRKLLRSGLGLGAPRWVAALLRHMQRPAITLDQTGSLTEDGRHSILKLASKMTGNFCAAVCRSSARNWRRLSIEKDFRLMIRESEPEELKGMVICAATSVSLSSDHQSIFKCLLKHHRSKWDIVSSGTPMEEKARIPKGRDDTNLVSLLAAKDGNLGILQETCTDQALAMVVCTPVNVAVMDQLMGGTDPAKVALLPSGFAVMPDTTGGSLLTVGFQVMVMAKSPDKLTENSLKPITSMLSNTLQNIQGALGCCK